MPDYAAAADATLIAASYAPSEEMLLRVARKER
jgi:hypothetical protein